LVSKAIGTGPLKKQASKEGIDSSLENTKDRTAGWKGLIEENTRIQVTPGKAEPIKNSARSGFGGGTKVTARGTRPLKKRFAVHQVK
jgi:hypothetical protein